MKEIINVIFKMFYNNDNPKHCSAKTLKKKKKKK